MVKFDYADSATSLRRISARESQELSGVNYRYCITYGWTE